MFYYVNLRRCIKLEFISTTSSVDYRLQDRSQGNNSQLLLAVHNARSLNCMHVLIRYWGLCSVLIFLILAAGIDMHMHYHWGS